MNQSKKSVVGIIPARYNSTRLPAKPLVLIKGKSMIQRVWENAKKSLILDEVYIATDDHKIQIHCEQFGAKVVMTHPELSSGTDRIFFSYQKLNLDHQIVVNIQGDEPLLLAEDIDKLVQEFNNSNAHVGTLIKKIDDIRDVLNPNVVKVTLDNNNTALYFSRSPIPYIRDMRFEDWSATNTFWKHIGVYAYKIDVLRNFCNLKQSPLELAESLEQLRLVENGYRYYCSVTHNTLISVDLAEDVKAVERYLESQSKRP